MDESPKYMKVAEVADALEVSSMTVYRMIRRGELPVYKFGKRSWKILVTDFQAYLEKTRGGKG